MERKSNEVEESRAKTAAYPIETFNTLVKFNEEIRSAQEISDSMLTRLYSSYIDSESGSEQLYNII
jgi:hypothetical protein